jgi:hypothetical protein
MRLVFFRRIQAINHHLAFKLLLYRYKLYKSWYCLGNQAKSLTPRPHTVINKKNLYGHHGTGLIYRLTLVWTMLDLTGLAMKNKRQMVELKSQ